MSSDSSTTTTTTSSGTLGGDHTSAATPGVTASNNNNSTSSATPLGGLVGNPIDLNFISNQLTRMGANFEERLFHLESNAKTTTTAAPNASVNQKKRPHPFGQPVTPHTPRGEQTFNSVGEMDEEDDILDDEVVSIDDEHTGASDLENENETPYSALIPLLELKNLKKNRKLLKSSII
eukprot:TRINITY_DN1347_c0_g2_i3.p1 TRINITY_DN1347_c0_g2~~TRINITY_DN1347_c0_g2_i3.p1  ORF type:complete len:178 (+),score=36.70 TRINITY_DN1347_c0_g2_i3:213-746(+)